MEIPEESRIRGSRRDRQVRIIEAPLPPVHAFFHGEKAPPPLRAGVVIAIGNCGIYTGPWGVRVEDTVVVGKDGPIVLTDYLYSLEPER